MQESIEKTIIQTIILAAVVPDIFFGQILFEGTIWRITSPEQINVIEAYNNRGGLYHSAKGGPSDLYTQTTLVP
jgi:hypothetical protein